MGNSPPEYDEIVVKTSPVRRTVADPSPSAQLLAECGDADPPAPPIDKGSHQASHKPARSTPAAVSSKSMNLCLLQPIFSC